MRIAGIGSRDLDQSQKAICRKLGLWIAICGHDLYSGNAEGADYAFAEGANSLDEAKVHLMLPWARFNPGQIRPGNQVLTIDQLRPDEYDWYLSLVRQYHPSQRLSQGALKLHLRNGMIVAPRAGRVDLVLAWPSQRPGGGGTGQGMRIAEGLGIRLIDLSCASEQSLFQLCEEISVTA